MRAVSYEADRLKLYIKRADGRSEEHGDIHPHLYNNLVETDDPDFYYAYYIEPSLIGRSSGFSSRARYALKLIGLLVLAGLMTATSLGNGSQRSAENASLSSETGLQAK
jgi:hypothetical protein